MIACFRSFGLMLVAVGCLLPAGCSGCNRPTKKIENVAKADGNPLDLARELYRSANEAARFREANDQTNKYLANEPDLLAKFAPGIKDRAQLQPLVAKLPGVNAAKLDERALYTQFLENIVGLDKTEREEVESGT